MGIGGVSSASNVAIGAAPGGTSSRKRSPKGRLPVWSWFCTKFTSAPSGCGGAQSMDAVLVDPIQRVVNEELAHRPAQRAIEVDRRAPRTRMRFRKELRRIAAEVIARRTEVVVDDVHEDHQPEPMRFLDEVL